MDTFSPPVGLNVLVVDDDPLCCLRMLDRMLEKCNYKVMSANDNTNVVMKGIMYGACDYLIKPVRMEELRNIWQHVFRQKGTCSPRVGFHSDWNASTRAGEFPEHISKKRKETSNVVEGLVEDTSRLKKARVNWSVYLHQKFVNAVNQLGLESDSAITEAVPSKLLDIMNVQDLTRENVASHLQKYRLYLKRLDGVVPEPCPIASFQASQDGTSGGTIQVLSRGKSSMSTPIVKGLNFGAGLAGSNTGGGRMDEGTMTSRAQLKASQQQKQAWMDEGTMNSLAQLKASESQKKASANRAPVLSGFKLVDPHLLSTSPSGGLYRKSSLDLRFQKNNPPAWKSVPNNALGDLAASGFKGLKLENEMSLRSCRPQMEGFLSQWEINSLGAHDVRSYAETNTRTQGRNKLNYGLVKTMDTCHLGKQAVGHIETPDDVSSFNLPDELSSCILTEVNREAFLEFNFNAIKGLSIPAPDNLVQNPEQLNSSEYLLEEEFPIDV